MFNIFGRKKPDYKKEKLDLIYKIESIEKRLEGANLFKVVEKLDEISKCLDNPPMTLSSNQIALIKDSLNQIDKYPKKAYENLLLRKCHQISMAIFEDEESVAEMRVTVKSDDKLFEMLGDLTSIDGQIKEIEGEMAKALGKDKNQWTLLNSQKTILQNRFAMINSNYQTLIKSIVNVNLASDARKTKEEASAILAQNETADIHEFTGNAEFTANVKDEVNDVSDKMNEIFLTTFGAGSSDSDYERALETKMISEMGGSPSNQATETL